MLSGYRTYISAAVIAAVTFAQTAGLIDQQAAEKLLWLAGSFGLAALRAAIK